MIVWINGAFGAGKTVTAAELHRRISGSAIYDPETVGFFLRKTVPDRERTYPDFQDDPLWRTINLRIISELSATYDGVILIPMTVISPDYYDELIGGLRRCGADVRHIVLGTSAQALRRRQRSRLEFSGSWSAEHAEKCLRALSSPPFEGYIDTTGMSIREAAEAVAREVGLAISPRGSFFSHICTKWAAQLGAIRR